MRRVVKRFSVHNNTQDMSMATNHHSESHVTPPMRLSLSVRGRSRLRRTIPLVTWSQRAREVTAVGPMFGRRLRQLCNLDSVVTRSSRGEHS